jgi:S1-C subfamily serine protease
MKIIRVLPIFLIAYFVCFMALAQSEKVESSLSAVVTVAVEKVQPVGKVILGFRGSVSEEAYERSLKLTNAVGSGSGFIVERNGKKYVVTNAHVVESAADERGSIYVYAYNRKKYEVKLLGGDSFYDVAVLEFIDNPGSELTSLAFAEKLPKIAERVYAIGNPLGDYPHTVTDGIISALNRTRGGLTGKFGYLQTTATMIWGNSGGPLINENAEVVGINSQIGFANGPDGNTYLQQQLNFSLEPLLSSRIVNEIIDNGAFKRAYLGLEIAQRHLIERTQRGYAIGRSITPKPIILDLVSGSDAAAKLGEYKGWSILQINGRDVESAEDALGELERVLPGADCKLKVSNNTRTNEITIKSGTLDNNKLEQIANHVLAKNKDITIDRSSAQLKLFLPTTPQSKQFNWASPSVETPPASKTGQSFFVIGGGMAGNNNSDVWRITTINDLGALLKIYGMRGGIEYFVTDNPSNTRGVRKLTQNFSGEDEVFQYTLWY